MGGPPNNWAWGRNLWAKSWYPVSELAPKNSLQGSLRWLIISIMYSFFFFNYGVT